jgi:hypothetical protein
VGKTPRHSQVSAHPRLPWPASGNHASRILRASKSRGVWQGCVYGYVINGTGQFVLLQSCDSTQVVIHLIYSVHRAPA